MLLALLLLLLQFCHQCLPPSDAQTSSSILASVFFGNTLGISDLRFLPPPFTLRNDGVQALIPSGFLGPQNHPHPPNGQTLCLAVRVKHEL